MTCRPNSSGSREKDFQTLIVIQHRRASDMDVGRASKSLWPQLTFVTGGMTQEPSRIDGLPSFAQ